MSVRLANENEIVIVDDDDVELLLAKRFLQRSRVPNDLLCFETGEAFLEHLQEVDAERAPMPALVLIDLRMPTMDGFEVVERIRQNPSFAKLPIVLLFSNSDEPSDIAKAEELGADGFVTKPSGGEEYVEFLNSLL